MPRLKPDTQRLRREHILNAAELCFAHSGFRGTTMQDICKAAAISAGALYIYFDSKEALIAGIAERDRAQFAERFQGLADAPDVMGALRGLAEKYFVEEPVHKRLMCVEIGIESTRNARVGEIHRSVDTYVRDSFEALFRRLKDDGRIAPDMEIGPLVQAFMTIGDGLFWRRAVDPTFDPTTALPTMIAVLTKLLRPVGPQAAPDTDLAPQQSQGEGLQ